MAQWLNVRWNRNNSTQRSGYRLVGYFMAQKRQSIRSIGRQFNVSLKPEGVCVAVAARGRGSSLPNASDAPPDERSIALTVSFDAATKIIRWCSTDSFFRRLTNLTGGKSADRGLIIIALCDAIRATHRSDSIYQNNIMYLCSFWCSRLATASE